MGYVDQIGESFLAPNGQSSSRLRLVFANGTQSNMLLTSLQRAFLDDPAGRRLTAIDHGPLFGDAPELGDVTTGTIYVLRSDSDNPYISENRHVIHKIGVTGGSVGTRITGAETQPTFLLAPVKVVATFTLYNINRVKLENLLHRVFCNAQLDMTIQDRFGKPVKPREWFLVPLPVIEEAVNRIKDGSIQGMIYAPSTATLISASA